MSEMQAAKRRTLWTTVVAVALLVVATTYPAAATAARQPAAGAAGSGSPLLAAVDVSLPEVDQVLDIGAAAGVELALAPPGSWTYLDDLARFAEDAKWRLDVAEDGLLGPCPEPFERLKTRVRGYQQSGGGKEAVELALSPCLSTTYDPSDTALLQRGVFVTADPLGYVDGPSMYAFAGFDPVNSGDPMGLYETDFHYSVVYYMSYLATFDQDMATEIATASQYVDDNEPSAPAGAAAYLGHHKDYGRFFEALRGFHFSTYGGDPVEPNGPMTRMIVDTAIQSGDALRMGVALHTLGDSFSHAGFTWREDSGVNSQCGGLASKTLHPVGHAHCAHKPDRPFLNPEKAADAALAVFDAVNRFYATKNSVRAGQLRAQFENRREWIRKELVAAFKNFDNSDKNDRMSSWSKFIFEKLGIQVPEYDAEALEGDYEWQGRFGSAISSQYGLLRMLDGPISNYTRSDPALCQRAPIGSPFEKSRCD